MSSSSFCFVVRRPKMSVKNFQLDGQTLNYTIFPESQVQHFKETADYAVHQTPLDLQEKHLIAFRQGFIEGCDRFSFAIFMPQEPLFAIHENSRTGTRGALHWDVYSLKAVPTWIAPLQRRIVDMVEQSVEEFFESPHNAQNQLKDAFQYFGEYCSPDILNRIDKQFSMKSNSFGGLTLAPLSVKRDAF
jgi:hypothetical protein